MTQVEFNDFFIVQYVRSCGGLECFCTSYENLGELEKKIRHQVCSYATVVTPTFLYENSSFSIFPGIMDKFFGVWNFVDCENFDEYLKGK
jgi:hypothetical protein